MNLKQRKARFSTMWIGFVFSVFLIILFSFIVLISLFVILIHAKLVFVDGRSPWIPLAAMTLTSIIVGTGLTIFVAKILLKPIVAFSHAMTKVAKGNFAVSVQYDGRILELQEMTANFNRMVHELGSIETLRNDFVVSVSHEFKTPLAAIEGYATILQDPNISAEEQQEYTQMIMDSTKQLSSLTSNILKLSKLDNQEIVTAYTHYRLDEQIRQSVLFFEQKWAQKKLNLNIDLDTLYFYGNEDLMIQVWINLIDNAIKFTPKNGELFLTLKEEAGEVKFTIMDTGIGVNEEIKNRIFDKFYQGDSSGSTSGNGLGLSLVKRILDLCKGTIHFDSQLGDGSTFTVTLPMKHPDGES